MSFKITKAEQTDIDASVGALASCRTDLDNSIEEFNAAIRDAWAKVEGDLASYNEAKFALGGDLRDIASQADSDFSEKSERWQDGDRGIAVREWIDGIERRADDLESELTIEQPSEIDINDETDFESYLEDLEQEPSY